MVDLIVGGASKAGTTALFEMLNSNLNFYLPAKKELHYFSLPFLRETTSGPGDRYVISNIPTNYNQYLSNFSGKKIGQISVDISPSYLYHSEAADEILSRLPEANIVFILRRPVDKIYSQYWHLVAEGRERLSFKDALEAEDTRKAQGYSDMFLYRESGFYFRSVEYYISKFGREKVKLILFDEFCRHPNKVLQELSAFMGLTTPQKFDTDVRANVSVAPRSHMLARFLGPNVITSFARNILPHSMGLQLRSLFRGVNSGRKPKLDKELEQRLMAVYKSDIVALEEIIGYKTGWYSCDNVEINRK